MPLRIAGILLFFLLPLFQTLASEQNEAKQEMIFQANGIKYPTVNFVNTDLEKMANALTLRSKMYDPTKKGISLQVVPYAPMEPLKITLRAEKLSLQAILSFLERRYDVVSEYHPDKGLVLLYPTETRTARWFRRRQHLTLPENVQIAAKLDTVKYPRIRLFSATLTQTLELLNSNRSIQIVLKDPQERVLYREVDLDEDGASLRKVLDFIAWKHDLDYRIVDGKLILFPLERDYRQPLITVDQETGLLLQTIKIPRFSVENLPLQDVIKYLNQNIPLWSEAGKNISIAMESTPSSYTTVYNNYITIEEQNTTLHDLLLELCKRIPFRLWIEKDTVILLNYSDF